MVESGARPVVLVTVDCLRADHVGCYGYDRPTTPEIDSFASDATVFESSFSNCPGTRWALQSLHTGLWTRQIDGLGVPDVEGASLASQFADRGYATGGFAHNGFLTRDYNYDDGFDRFDDVHTFRNKQSPLRQFGARVTGLLDNDTVRKYGFSLYRRLEQLQTDSDTGFRPEVTDEEVCTNAIQWIEQQQATDRPYFAWVHLMDAHTPYARWDDHLESVRGDTDVEHVVDPADHVTPGDDPDDAVIDAYDAGIRSADEQVGRLLNAIDSTATVVITGDHGEEFGSHGEFHAASLHGNFTQVPIIVRSPNTEPGRIDSYPVQHLDIPPTLLHATGDCVPSHYVGASLQTVAREADQPVYFCLDDSTAVRVGDWKQIHDETAETSTLYYSPYGAGDRTDWDIDPPMDPEAFGRLDEEQREWMAENGLYVAEGEFDDRNEHLSDEVKDNLEELGYI